MTGPGRPKGGARNHRHALLDEQLLGERLVIHAGAGDLGEAVEGAARLEAAQPDLVQAPGHQLAAMVVFGLHLEHEALT